MLADDLSELGFPVKIMRTAGPNLSGESVDHGAINALVVDDNIDLFIANATAVRFYKKPACASARQIFQKYLSSSFRTQTVRDAAEKKAPKYPKWDRDVGRVDCLGITQPCSYDFIDLDSRSVHVFSSPCLLALCIVPSSFPMSP